MYAQPDIQLNSRWQNIVQQSQLWLFVIVVTLGIALILSFNLVRGPQVSVMLGEPAPEAVVAPQSETYISEVLTERARQSAAAAVSDQYTVIDLGIGREQNNNALSVFSFVEVVRADPLTSTDVKQGYLNNILDLTLDGQVATDILTLTPNEFTAVRDNISQIIQDTMREGVIEDELSEARRKASLGANFNLTTAQERIVTSLAPQFIVPNIFFDAEATSQAQTAAREAVEPISQNITQGQDIIRVGDIIDEEDIEKLQRLGLLQQTTNWQVVVSSLLIAFLSVSALTLYWSHFTSRQYRSPRHLGILAAMLLLFVLGAKLLIPGRTDYAYLFPAAALSLITAAIFEIRLALLVTVILAFLVGYIGQDSLEMAFYSAAGGILAVLSLKDTQRLNSLFRAGLLVGVVNVAVILLFWLPDDPELTELLTLFLFGSLNGAVLSAGFSVAGIFVIGSVFQVITMLQLQELSRLDHPLLQELLRRAPGTYHHSIMVANLAEQAAEKVRANSTLVRVGAFYHDIGKMNRPPFFGENQNGGNPHDHLDPYVSARIIISHVSDGLELARRYRLPNRIHDFIAEHHGNRVVKVFYKKAQEMANEDEVIDISRFNTRGRDLAPGKRASSSLRIRLKPLPRPYGRAQRKKLKNL
jgi:putative nucleotidyltransferase with HDIG domain